MIAPRIVIFAFLVVWNIKYLTFFLRIIDHLLYEEMFIVLTPAPCVTAPTTWLSLLNLLQHTLMLVSLTMRTFLESQGLSAVLWL